MSSQIQDHTKLRNLMVSYGSYHHNKVNKIIHLICIPLILVSALALLQHVNVVVGEHKLDLSFYALAAIMLFYLSLDKFAGIAAVVLYYTMWRLQREYFKVGDQQKHWNIALTIHIICWILQFVGHGVFEKRKPALLDNIFQVFAAPMFVIVEVLFFIGWRPQLNSEFEIGVAENIKRWNESKSKSS